MEISKRKWAWKRMLPKEALGKETIFNLGRREGWTERKENLIYTPNTDSGCPHERSRAPTSLKWNPLIFHMILTTWGSQAKALLCCTNSVSKQIWYVFETALGCFFIISWVLAFSRLLPCSTLQKKFTTLLGRTPSIIAALTLGNQKPEMNYPDWSFL